MRSSSWSFFASAPARCFRFANHLADRLGDHLLKHAARPIHMGFEGGEAALVRLGVKGVGAAGRRIRLGLSRRLASRVFASRQRSPSDRFSAASRFGEAD